MSAFTRLHYYVYGQFTGSVTSAIGPETEAHANKSKKQNKTHCVYKPSPEFGLQDASSGDALVQSLCAAAEKYAYEQIS
jgi:hypothetical protein